MQDKSARMIILCRRQKYLLVGNWHFNNGHPNLCHKFYPRVITCIIAGVGFNIFLWVAHPEIYRLWNSFSYCLSCQSL